MTPLSGASDFFVAGGALHPDSPSYVKRAADDELFNLVLSGELCYVLTSRQMGKSSLMARTHRRLREHGIRTAIIDLTAIGMADAEQWYLVIACILADQLGLSVDPVSWWQERASHSVVHRFTRFLRDVVLEEIEGSVVVFVDEIDTTLKLNFSDDFFAAIRYTYNACATDPTYSRLTFVLLGSAIPSDLIEDATRTPFNVGREIDLRELNREDAQVLQKGLEAACPGQGDAILDRIFYWTGGHPYLTQKLCLAVTQVENWTKAKVDGIVEKLFLSEEARRESNLQFVRRSIEDSPDRRRLLSLYRKVYLGKEVPKDERSLDQNRLRLFGLVTGENGVLKVRNEIYRSVFDLDWVKRITPINWLPVVISIASISVFVAMLAVSSLAYNVWVGIYCNESIANFYQAGVPEERVIHLTRMLKLRVLFGPGDCRYQAIGLFNGLSREEQLALFGIQNMENADMVVLVRGLYTMAADVDGTGSTRPLLEAMSSGLRNLDLQEAKALKREIDSWIEGRELTEIGRYDEALDKYDNAIALNGENPATLYERARVLIGLSRYQEALSDLDRVMAVAGRAPVAPTPTVLSITITPTTFIEMPSILPSVPPTATLAVSPESILTPVRTPTSNIGLTPNSISAHAIAMPTPSPAVGPTSNSSIALEFATIGQIRRAVEDLIFDGSREIILSLANAPNSAYPNLRDFELVPVPTLPPTQNPTPTLSLGTEGVATATRTLTPTNLTAVVSTLSPLESPGETQAVAETPLIPRTWVPAGSLTDGRHDHTATLMLDGRVLIVGGLQDRAGSPGLASVEVYDPASRTWSTTDSLNNGRLHHTATLLPDGTVLVTGGWSSRSGPTLDSVEIYNPISGTWSSAPPLSVPRRGHTATRLADGRVLVVGGRFGFGNADVNASAEIYDPASGVWSPTGALTVPREGHRATLLPDGRVLVVNGSWLPTNEIYDPVSGAWSETTASPVCHGVAHTATLLSDGRVLVVGGACGSGTPGIRDVAEIYDSATSTWIAAAALPETRESHTATLRPDGTVLIVGGDNGGPPRYDSALIYDPASNVWSSTGSLTTGRRDHTATLLDDGTVLAVGGWGDTTTYLESAELYQAPHQSDFD